MPSAPSSTKKIDATPSRSLAPHSPSLLRARDVAALLAISVRCVWRLVASGDLPRPIKLGGSTRWRACDLDAFIAEAGAEQRTGVGARR